MWCEYEYLCAPSYIFPFQNHPYPADAAPVHNQHPDSVTGIYFSIKRSCTVFFMTYYSTLLTWGKYSAFRH